MFEVVLFAGLFWALCSLGIGFWLGIQYKIHRDYEDARAEHRAQVARLKRILGCEEPEGPPLG